MIFLINKAAERPFPELFVMIISVSCSHPGSVPFNIGGVKKKTNSEIVQKKKL